MQQLQWDPELEEFQLRGMFFFFFFFCLILILFLICASWLILVKTEFQCDL